MTTGDPQELLNNYVEAFASGKKPATPIRGIQARVCRRRSGDPVRLSDDPERRIVFLVDHRVCHQMIGLTGYEIASTFLGWDAPFIKKKVEAGIKFDLVVFPETTCLLGAWDNLLDLVEAAYPEIGAKIARHRASLCAMTPANVLEIEGRLGYRFLDVDERGKQDPRFTNLARYVDMPDTADAARAFLYHVVYCKESFSGEGCTLDGQLNVSVPEYIMPDRPLERLGVHAVIPIDIQIPRRLRQA